MQNLAIKGGIFYVSFEKKLIRKNGLSTGIIKEGFGGVGLALSRAALAGRGKAKAKGAASDGACPVLQQ